MGIFLRVLCVCFASGLLFATLGASIPTDCCPRTSKTVLRQASIIGYHRQEVVICPVKAVVFTTVLGKRVCADPTKPWVKKAVKYIDSQKQRTTTVTAQVPVTTEVLSTNSTEPIRNATTLP